jgi:hypothetical protein
MTFLILSLRSVNMGSDLQRYYAQFIRIGNMPFLDAWNDYNVYPGYLLLSYFVAKTTGNFQIFLCAVALISVAALYYFLKENSKHPYISILVLCGLGYYDFLFSGLKQAVAMSFCLYSFKFIKEKRLAKFLIIVGIAMSFHFTAIIFLPIYFYLNSKFSKKMVYISIPFIVALYVYRLQVALFLTKVFRENYIGHYTVDNSVSLVVVFILLMIIIAFLFFKEKIWENKMYNMCFRMAFLSLILQFLSSYAYLYTRLNLYYFPFLALLIPETIMEKPGSIMGKYVLTENSAVLVKIVISSIFIILFLYLYNSFVLGDVSGLYPYEFFWEI